MNSEFYRTKVLRNENQAAQYLEISKQTLRRLRRAGRIGYFQIGKRILYGDNHLERYLSSVSREVTEVVNAGAEGGEN
jgi:excisionase family DNA binding protein